jgi:glutamate-1-semialdehyde 2,1-aminomutase
MSAPRKPRTAEETALLRLTERLLPSGVRNASVNPDYAMVVREARGCRITDMSGNEYIDYLLGSGPMLLGHAHPAVVAAVRDQLERGTSYLMINEPAIRLAELLVELVPCAEQVSFHSSGSEATFFAMRLARAHRRRSRILKFEGGFHGMSDYALMSNQWTRAPADYPHAVANSAGIPASITAEVLVAPFNDGGSTATIIERHHDELAGVIVEPLQRTFPPKPGFLDALREVTRHYGIPLIFDEVVTGFRLALGGAQTYYGVTPDLCALGKSISGGHPIGVVCGSTAIMSAASPARMAAGGHVLLTGTFSANPVSARAALACNGELRRPGCYERLAERGGRLKAALQGLFDEAGIPARVTGEASVFEPWFTDREVADFRSARSSDAGTSLRFIDLLLERGVIKAHEKFFVSTAHSDDDIAETIAACAAAVSVLAAERRRRTGAR